MQNTWRWANWDWPVDPTVVRDRAYWGLCSPLGGCGSLLVSKMAPTAPAVRSGLRSPAKQLCTFPWPHDDIKGGKLRNDVLELCGKTPQLT